MADEEKVVKRAPIKSGTIIAPCLCKHDFQDKQYKGQRLHNICAKGTKRRCTVCGKEVGL